MKKMRELFFKFSNEIKGLIYGAFMFLNINVDIVKILLILMLLDTVFGIVKSIVIGRIIRFSRLFEGVVTKTMLLLIPMVLALVSKGLGYDFNLLPDTVLKLFIVAEGFSIINSCYVIKTKKEPEEIDLISIVIKLIRNFMLNIFNSMTKKQS